MQLVLNYQSVRHRILEDLNIHTIGSIFGILKLRVYKITFAICRVGSISGKTRRIVSFILLKPALETRELHFHSHIYVYCLALN
jgi:hypothetical protein